MARHAFPARPDQAAQISAAHPELASEGLFGLEQGWDAPVALWRARAGFDIVYRGHAHATLTFIRAGAGVERMDGRFAGRRGGPEADSYIVYLGDGESRRYASSGEVALGQIYFQPAFLGELTAAEPGPARAGLGSEGTIFGQDRELRRLVEGYVARALGYGGAPSAPEMDALAVLLALRLVRAHAPGRSADQGRASRSGLGARRLRRVLEHIDADLAGDASLATLSALVGLSPQHFCTAFRRSTGRTPHRYVLDRRVDRAKQLLLGGDGPLSRIALDCGFASQQHLTTTFKRSAGVSPARFRAMARD